MLIKFLILIFKKIIINKYKKKSLGEIEINKNEYYILYFCKKKKKTNRCFKMNKK